MSNIRLLNISVLHLIQYLVFNGYINITIQYKVYWKGYRFFFLLFKKKTFLYSCTLFWLLCNSKITLYEMIGTKDLGSYFLYTARNQILVKLSLVLYSSCTTTLVKSLVKFGKCICVLLGRNGVYNFLCF